MNALLNENCIRLPKYWATSAWTEHVPFAFWIVSAVEPRTIVELGAHYGMSYFAFCQAVAENKLNTSCTAVDTWEGDEHAGFYSNDVFSQVDGYNSANYSDFSALLRMTFDDALGHVPDGSVDILHVDGRHFYEDVKRDFESWIPKLSDRGVVLFHDTMVRKRQFGVWKFWEELKDHYPSFNFHHGHGLGVLAVGENVPPALERILSASSSSSDAESIRELFSTCGQSLGARANAAAREKELARLRDELSGAQAAARELASSVDSLQAEVDSLQAQGVVDRQILANTRAALTFVRRNPLRNLGVFGKFHVYNLMSSLTAPMSDQVGKRFRQAAERRNPGRCEAQTKRS